MIKGVGNYNLVRESVAKLLHARVVIIQNLGRNKFLKYFAKISGVYPALFTIEPEEKVYVGKTSFSYNEIMCNQVVIKTIKEQDKKQ
ncbi:MAG: Veg family protein [Christensenellaceae bacterium]